MEPQGTQMFDHVGPPNFKCLSLQSESGLSRHNPRFHNCILFQFDFTVWPCHRDSKSSGDPRFPRLAQDIFAGSDFNWHLILEVSRGPGGRGERRSKSRGAESDIFSFCIKDALRTYSTSSHKPLLVETTERFDERVGSWMCPLRKR